VPEPSGLSLSVATCTDVGRRRQNNEDRCLVLSLDDGTEYDGQMAAIFNLGFVGVILAIADGMGGHQSGEVASALSIFTLAQEIKNRTAEGKMPAEGPNVELERAVEAVNGTVYARAGQQSELRGMGTTLTVAWLAGGSAVVAHVGDSRAYLFRTGELFPLTQDQTVGNLLGGEGGVAQVSEHVRDMLTQAIGAQPQVRVALTESALAVGDFLMLCCDGLYKVVGPEEIKQVLGSAISLWAKTEALVARANEHGGPDNITVVLAEVTQAGEQG
jgi:PPM family protein phosphatase